MEFQAWQKMSRLFRDITVTEKIDGTNACIRFAPFDENEEYPEENQLRNTCGVIFQDTEPVVVGAQSRKRMITPDDDNFGFAKWVWNNSASLFRDLGYGNHYGEWWGAGIQRGYGMMDGLDRRFSLFNTKKWYDQAEYFETPNLGVVPVLYMGVFSELEIQKAAVRLDEYGSEASPGFRPAEGVVVYFHQANICMKYTPFENNDGHKGN